MTATQHDDKKDESSKVAPWTLAWLAQHGCLPLLVLVLSAVLIAILVPPKEDDPVPPKQDSITEEIDVPAVKPFVTTKYIDNVNGRMVDFSAHGTWTIGDDGQPMVSAAGYEGKAPREFLVEGAAPGCLVGRWSGQKDWFVIGTSLEGAIAGPGKLHLAMNEDTKGQRKQEGGKGNTDNSGEVTVSIFVHKPQGE